MTAPAEFIELTKRLLTAIAAKDWDTYTQLCSDDLTAFEPEAVGQLVEGLGFHKTYFQPSGNGPKSHSTLSQPHVRMLGPDAAVICYVRLVQVPVDGSWKTVSFEETRVWQKIDGNWKHVHFHRSPAN